MVGNLHVGLGPVNGPYIGIDLAARVVVVCNACILEGSV